MQLTAAGLRPLIGRGRELGELRARLSAERLVTVTGPAGVGKTRLALAAIGPSNDGAAAADLGALADPAHLADTLLAAVGGEPERGVAPEATLRARLAETEITLLVDNCEHLRGPVAELAARLLVAAPGLRILATSQVELGVPGEVVFELGPLSGGTDGDGVRLFLDRASRTARGFSADAEATARIARLCDELDGLPLAIELAAARTRLFGVQQIAEDLGRRLDLLAGGPVDHPRHRSLRASLDWSVGLLSDAEQALFERLSVFAGGCELTGAEAVCAGSPLAAGSILELLAALVERALVGADRSETGTRFTMLTTVRAYAAERLDASGGADACRRAHAAYCVALVEEADRALRGPAQAAALARLDREAGNIRAALAWASESDPAAGLRIAVGLAIPWHIGGQITAGREALEPLLPAARAADPELRARALWAHGLLLVAAGELRAAAPVVAEAVGRARDLGQPVLVARALAVLGELDLMTGPTAAIAPLEEAAALARAAGDEWCLADVLGKLGAAAVYKSSAARARPPFEECLEIARRTGDARTTHRAIGGLARVTAIEGDAEAAIALLRDGLAISERLGDRSWIALDLTMLGELERFAGRAREGLAEVTRGLALAEEIDAAYPRYMAIGILGRIALELGEPEVAAERFATVLALAESTGWRPFRSWWEIGLADARLALGDAAGARAAAQAALVTAQALGNERDAGRATALLGMIAEAGGEREVAISLICDALAVHAEAGDAPAARRALGALIAALTAAGRGERAERIRLALGRGADGLAEATALALRGRGTRRREREGGWGGLTRAEAEVAELAAAGESNPEIAARLFMSRSTVKTHLARVYAKLDVANRTELAGALAAVRDPGRDGSHN